MNKYGKIISIILSLVIVSLIFASCGSKAKDSASEISEDFGMANLYTLTTDSDTATGVEESAKSASESTATVDRKLVKNAVLSAQTENFDKFISEFEISVSKYNGYIENSSISGNDYYYASYRNASIVARVPADKLDEFLNIVSDMATINSKQISINDITSTYIDTESRLKALETEQTALLNILEKASNVSDIIEVQSRLSEVNGQIESYKAQMKNYDNQVEYSTITLYIDEVERVTSSESTGFFQEIKNRLSDNLYNIGQGLREFAIWIISSIPYIAIFAVILVVAVIILKKIIKKRKIKKKTISE